MNGDARCIPGVCGVAGAVLLLALTGCCVEVNAAQAASAAAGAEKAAVSAAGKFYCHSKALNAAERAHHKELSDKLLGARKESVETPTGYEFHFDPKEVTLAELADWVGAESRCCPFFDFHIDVEAEGHLLCLRLTGEEGVKAFIRAEFGVK
jgi:hypothetical protein